MKDERIFSVHELANILGIKDTTLTNLLRNKKIKGFKVGKLWRIRESDLDEWIEGVGNWIDWHKKSLNEER